LRRSHEHRGRGSWGAFRNALRGELPPRYAQGFRTPFDARARRALRDGVEILDVGAGRRPTIPVSDRPPGSRYVALDASAAQLELAPAGVYDETVVADLVDHLPGLEDRFGLILSWNVLEHVPHLETALSNLRSYLRPGGRLVAQFAGTFAAHALLSRLIPRALAAEAMERLLNRPRDTVFDAHYDRCRYSALDDLLAPFSTHTITTHYRDASYFRFSRLAQAVYLGYEEWALRGQHRNLATHYLVCAER
jgi:SAM-dependent methyltransferase